MRDHHLKAHKIFTDTNDFFKEFDSKPSQQAPIYQKPNSLNPSNSSLLFQRLNKPKDIGGNPGDLL